jgi:hypothetical protein
MSAVNPSSLNNKIFTEFKEPLKNNLIDERIDQKKDQGALICQNLIHSVDCATHKKFPPELLSIICSYEGNTISKTNSLLNEILCCDGLIQDPELKLNLRVWILYNNSGTPFRICNLFLKNDTYWYSFFNKGSSFTNLEKEKEFNNFFRGFFLPWKQKIIKIWQQFLTDAKFLCQLDLSNYEESDKEDILSMAACILNQQEISGIQKLILPHQVIKNPSYLCCCAYSFSWHNSTIQKLENELQKFSLDTKKIKIEFI